MNVFSWISIKNSITYPKHSQIHFITATLQKALQYHLDSGIGRLGTWNKTSLQFINTVTMRASIVVVVSLITYYVENTLGIGKVNQNNIITPDPLDRFWWNFACIIYIYTPPILIVCILFSFLWIILSRRWIHEWRFCQCLG